MATKFLDGEHPLPFNEQFQEAVVGHCLTNLRFFMKCKDKLRSQWFSRNIMLGTIFSQLQRLYEADGSFITSIEEFKNSSFFLELSNDERDKYYHLIAICQLSADNFDLNKIERQLTGFLRISMFKESVEGAARRYKNQGFDEAYVWTKQRINEIQEAEFEDSKDVLPFDHPETWILNQETRRSNAMSTGSEVLDKALGGGLFRKETCAFMAPSNVGKTTAMITVARHAVMQGYDVMFLIHEGDPEEIRIRLLCALMGITQATIFEWVKDREKRKWVNAAAAILKAKLTFVPYIKTGSMYIEDVLTLIRKLNDERKLQKGTQGYDLIIDDYPKKLRSRARSNSREGLHRVELAEIYDEFNHLATELNAHCFVAIQTNRTGLRQNNNTVQNDRLLGMEEIDEAYGVAQNMANIITLNRSPDDRHRNIMRMNIGKSRNNKTDVAINTRTNYDCYLIFGDKNRFTPHWPTDLKNGFLAAYYQENNIKETVDVVDTELMSIEDALSKHQDVGALPAGGKLEA